MWKPGKVRARIPKVNTNVTATANPHNHHSRHSTSRTRGKVVSTSFPGWDRWYTWSPNLSLRKKIFRAGRRSVDRSQSAPLSSYLNHWFLDLVLAYEPIMQTAKVSRRNAEKLTAHSAVLSGPPNTSLNVNGFIGTGQ